MRDKGGYFQPRDEAGLEKDATVGCRQICIYFDSINMKRGFEVIIVEMSPILFYYELINYVLFMICSLYSPYASIPKFL